VLNKEEGRERGALAAVIYFKVVRSMGERFCVDLLEAGMDGSGRSDPIW
jgi:hypothetical protein